MLLAVLTVRLFAMPSTAYVYDGKLCHTCIFTILVKSLPAKNALCSRMIPGMSRFGEVRFLCSHPQNTVSTIV